jgi:hypothetical protein
MILPCGAFHFKLFRRATSASLFLLLGNVITLNDIGITFLMASNLVRGIVYSVFDEKYGPEPSVWLPATLPKEMLDVVSWESINMRIRMNKVMMQLCHIPLPKFKTKMLVKMFQYSDKNKRGHACDTTLALLFNEEDDLIFYKYVRDFEDIFEKYAIEINEIQEIAADKGIDKGKLAGKIGEFQVALDRLIESLHAAEMAISDQDQQAFPEGDHEGSAAPRATPVKYKLVVCRRSSSTRARPSSARTCPRSGST